MISIRLNYYNFNFFLLWLVAVRGSLEHSLKDLCLFFFNSNLLKYFFSFFFFFQKFAYNIYIITMMLVSKVFPRLNGLVLKRKVVLIEFLEVVVRGGYIFFFKKKSFWTSFFFCFYIIISYTFSCVVAILECFFKNTCKVVRKLNLVIFRVFEVMFILKSQIQYLLKHFILFYFITYGSNKNNILYFSSRRSEIDRCRFSYNRFSRSWCWYWYRVCRFNSRFIKKSTLFRFIVSLCYFRFCFNGSNGSISHYDGILDFEQLNLPFRSISYIESFKIRVYFFSLLMKKRVYKYSGLCLLSLLIKPIILKKKEQLFNFIWNFKYKLYDE